jgi:cytochrome c553
MKKLLTAAIACALIGVAGTTMAAGNADAGKTKSATCMACHGPDGNSPTNPVWPKLAGQHASYIIKQLNGTDQTMSPMAAPLQAQDIEDLAAYFSSQPRKIGEADPALVAKGEAIYRGGDLSKGLPACIACHGPKGAGNGPANFPSIGGQHAAYVEGTLKKFRSGERANDINRMMRDIAAKMTDAEIKAVASYVSGLH